MFRQCFDRLEMSHDRSHVHAKICLAGQFTSIFIETRWFQQSRIYDSNSLFHAHLKLRLELRQVLEGGVPRPASPLLYSPLFFFHRFPEFFFCFQKNNKTLSKRTLMRRGITRMWGFCFFFFEKCDCRNDVDCYRLVEMGEKRDVEPEWALLSM